MLGKITSLHQSKSLKIKEGFWQELSCVFCEKEKIILAETRNELMNSIHKSGWKEIESKEFTVSGHYCGCKYY